MSESTFSFDSTGVEPAAAFDTLPSGWYRAMITTAELKPTKAGNGKYLELTWKVLEGDHTGRIVWDRLNVINANATAQEIAERALSAICHAVGVLKFRSPPELAHKPAMIKVVIKVEKDREPSNEVKGYKAADGNGKIGPAVAAVARKHGTMKPEDDDDALPF